MGLPDLAGRGFNATTAFLLRGIDLPGSGVVSFQCQAFCVAVHTGCGLSIVSMPPRRSCFQAEGRHLTRGAQCWRFQCHHGVPASRSRGDAIARVNVSFNATTAFLLPLICRYKELSLHCLRVSMPPRRSCFPPIEVNEGLADWRFNATTAFLLPALISLSLSSRSFVLLIFAFSK
jgi:hypothetical protein